MFLKRMGHGKMGTKQLGTRTNAYSYRLILKINKPKQMDPKKNPWLGQRFCKRVFKSLSYVNFVSKVARSNKYDFDLKIVIAFFM